jgi:hypothetical protein
VKNGDETAADCGNSCPDCANGVACDSNDDCQSGACIGGFCRAATCFDGVKNGGETAVDCGGACAPCANGQACTVWGDCQSGFCWASVAPARRPARTA